MASNVRRHYKGMLTTMTAEAALLGEVDAVIRVGSPHRCSQMLRRVTDLFLVSLEQYSEYQIAVFDDVLVRLAAEGHLEQ